MKATNDTPYPDKIGEPIQAGDLVQLRLGSANEMFSIQQFDDKLAVYPAGTAISPALPGVVLTPEIARQLLVVEHHPDLA